MPSHPLGPAVSGERFQFDGLSAYVAGQGPPLLLLHSVNAAASVAEVRPLFEHYRTTRTVFRHRPARLRPQPPGRPRLHPAADDRRAARHGRAGAPALRPRAAGRAGGVAGMRVPGPRGGRAKPGHVPQPGAGQPHRLSGHCGPGAARRAAHAACPRCTACCGRPLWAGGAVPRCSRGRPWCATSWNAPGAPRHRRNLWAVRRSHGAQPGASMRRCTSWRPTCSAPTSTPSTKH
jgi:hypothetical protein